MHELDNYHGNCGVSTGQLLAGKQCEPAIAMIGVNFIQNYHVYHSVQLHFYG